MHRCILLLSLLTAVAICAEDRCLVQQFTLTDGRVFQAVRMIKIATPKSTSYLVTLLDETKMSFSGEDVLKVSEVYLPASVMPPTLNVPKKTEPQVASKPAPPPSEVPEEPNRPEPDPYAPYEVSAGYDNGSGHHHHRPNPQPPCAPNICAPRATPTASDRARQAFSTIPSFQYKK